MKRTYSEMNKSPLEQLLSASSEGNLELLEELLDDPLIDPSINDNQVIIIASNNGHFNIVNRLLEDPRLVITGTEQYRVPNIIKRLNIAKRTFNNELIINIKNKYKFIKAVKNGNLEILDKIMNGPNFDINEYLEHINLLYINSDEIFERLIQDPNIDTELLNEYLVGASIRNELNNVDKILRNTNFDPSYTEDISALHYASQRGHINIVNRLLQDPRITSEDVTNALESASSRGHLEVVNILLQDPRVDPSEALLSATHDVISLDIIDRLLRDPRVDPNFSDWNGYTPIIELSRFGNLEIVNRLLDDPRVDPSATDNFAIIEASEYGNLEVVNRLLQDPRVDPRARNNGAIRLASQNGHLDVVNRLLDDPRINWNDESLPDAVKQLILGKRIENLDRMDAFEEETSLPDDANRNIFDFLKRFGSNKCSNRKKRLRRNSRKLCF